MALAYFDDTVSGVEELWVADGTVPGTHAVASFDTSAISSLTTIGSRVFFAVDDGVHGQELWTSDGTAAGTVMVKDINPGSDGSFPSELTNVNGTLYFEADGGTHGEELWKSDATAAGTVMVKDIDAGIGSSSRSDLAAVNGTVEFYAYDGASEDLFRSDGTAAGTIELATNVEDTTQLGVTAGPEVSVSDILWQNANGQAASWEMNGANVTLLDYRLPRADNLLEFDFETRNVPSTTNPMGLKGRGRGRIDRGESRGHECGRRRPAAPIASSTSTCPRPVRRVRRDPAFPYA